MDYVIIYMDCLFSAHVDTGEAIALPPSASLVNSQDWSDMVTAAGNEQNLINNLGIVGDYRTL